MKVDKSKGKVEECRQYFDIDVHIKEGDDEL